MTVPMELQHASEEFEKFLVRARDISGLATRNQTYTMVEAVLHVFRRRLELKAAIRFAGALPPILRAIFVADWNTDEATLPFDDRSSMTREVQSIRGDHNFSPDTCIRDVATAMRAAVDVAAFDTVLASLPKGALAFWRVEGPPVG
jgi:uncharacterized protein (DUF2267 family)